MGRVRRVFKGGEGGLRALRHGALLPCNSVDTLRLPEKVRRTFRKGGRAKNVPVRKKNHIHKKATIRWKNSLHKEKAPHEERKALHIEKKDLIV